MDGLTELTPVSTYATRESPIFTGQIHDEIEMSQFLTDRGHLLGDNVVIAHDIDEDRQGEAGDVFLSRIITIAQQGSYTGDSGEDADAKSKLEYTHIADYQFDQDPSSIRFPPNMKSIGKYYLYQFPESFVDGEDPIIRCRFPQDSLREYVNWLCLENIYFKEDKEIDCRYMRDLCLAESCNNVPCEDGIIIDIRDMQGRYIKSCLKKNGKCGATVTQLQIPSKPDRDGARYYASRQSPLLPVYNCTDTLDGHHTDESRLLHAMCHEDDAKYVICDGESCNPECDTYSSDICSQGVDVYDTAGWKIHTCLWTNNKCEAQNEPIHGPVPIDHNGQYLIQQPRKFLISKHSAYICSEADMINATTFNILCRTNHAFNSKARPVCSDVHYTVLCAAQFSGCNQLPKYLANQEVTIFNEHMEKILFCTSTSTSGSNITCVLKVTLLLIWLMIL